MKSPSARAFLVAAISLLAASALPVAAAAGGEGCKPSPGVEVVWRALGAVIPGSVADTEIRITPRLPVERIQLTVAPPEGLEMLGPLPSFDGPAATGETLTFPVRVRAPEGRAPSLRARVDVVSRTGRYGVGASLDLTPERFKEPAAHGGRLLQLAEGSQLEFPASAVAGGMAGAAASTAEGSPSAAATLTGRFYYRDRVFDQDGFIHAVSSANPMKPIRRADVELIRTRSAVQATVASGSTDDSGAFSLTAPDALDTDTFTVKVLSTIQNWPVLDVRVRISANQPTVYSAITPSLQKPASGTHVGEFVVEPLMGGEAFNVLDSCVDGALLIESLTGSLPSSGLSVNWSQGSTIGTYFTRGASSGSISLLGEEAYDDCVVIHEYGHYAASFYSNDDSPGQLHYIDDSNQDVRLSWSEGWSSYFQSAARRLAGDPHPTWYVDTSGESGAGQLNFSYECEGPSYAVQGTASEVVVQSLLWDIEDGLDTPDEMPGSDDDPLSLPRSQIWEVLTGPLMTATYVSLEDFWEGWMNAPVANGYYEEMKAAFGALGVEYVPDEHEADNVPAAATDLPLDGTPVHHTFYGVGDVDYHRVTLAAGERVVVETLNVLGWGDTYLEVFDPAATLIAYNADRTTTDISSIVTAIAPVSGEYLVKVHRESKGKALYAEYGSYDMRAIRGSLNTLSLTALAATAPIANTGYSVGAAWGDYDGDDDPDCYVVNNTAAGSATAVDALFQNLGNRSFSNATLAAGLGNPEGGVGAAWADYDNDGDLDLFVTGHGLFRNLGNGRFADATAASGVVDLGREFDAAWADADADGWLDLVVISREHPFALWHNNADGTFTDVAPSAGFESPADGGNGYACAWGDYDGDRMPDLFVAKLDAPAHVLYHNLGGNQFENVTEAAGVASTTGAQGASWGDIDNNGRLDLFVASTGENALYVNRGDGTFANEAARYGVNDPNTAVGSGFVDYDLDGDLDLFVVNLTTSDLMFQNLGGTMIRVDHVLAPAVVTGPDYGCSWADVDADGDADLYLTRGCTSASCLSNLLYINGLNDGAAPRPWLKVKLQGQTANRDGIGALILVHAGEHHQAREVGTNVGWASKSRVPELFGFPTGATVDSVEVFWPSRHYNIVRHPSSNTVLNILEDVFTPVIPPEVPPPFAVALRGPFPNPFRSATGMGFTLTRDADVTVEIFDVVGRRVRRLLDGRFPAGDHVAGWDGEDDRAVAAPAGLYFYRITAGGRTEVRRLMRIAR
jgi:hypothetical protein